MAIISAIMEAVKGMNRLISYAPLWRTMAEQKKTTYTLRVKYGMSHATVQRLQKDLPVSTHTLDKLCALLKCRLDEVAVYVPNEETPE